MLPRLDADTSALVVRQADVTPCHHPPLTHPTPGCHSGRLTPQRPQDVTHVLVDPAHMPRKAAIREQLLRLREAQCVADGGSCRRSPEADGLLAAVVVVLSLSQSASSSLSSPRCPRRARRPRRFIHHDRPPATTPVVVMVGVVVALVVVIVVIVVVVVLVIVAAVFISSSCAVLRTCYRVVYTRRYTDGGGADGYVGKCCWRRHASDP